RITLCREIVDVDMVTLSSGNLRSAEWFAVSIQVQHVRHGFFDIAIHPQARTETVTNSRNTVGLIQPHMCKMRGYGCVVFVFCQLGKEEVSLNPEVSFIWCFFFTVGHMKV